MGLRTKYNILSLLENKTKNYDERVALGIKNSFGWKEYTYKGLGLMTRKVACHLINDIGIKKGEIAAILSESKPEYGACVFASVISGMTTVPLDIKLTIYELTSILLDCEPTVLFVSQHYLDTALELQKKISSIKYIILMDEHSKNSGIENMYELPDNYEAKWRHRSSKSTALIIYTSGTTGAPKGVEISFANMMAQLDDLGFALSKILPKQEVNVLSILPMNHLFEMTVGFSTFLNAGFSVFYAQSLKPKDILGIMREKRVEFMIVVPAFLKLLKSSIEKNLHDAPVATRLMFKFLYHAAKFVPNYGLKKFMFKPIHDKFGGHFSGCISGGAPMDIDVARFFERIGIKVMQGYGLSETSPVVSVNWDRRHDLASVGKPLPHFEYKIDPDSKELLLRGPSVMKGYHNQPELTAQTVDEDGWLHTGDIAEINMHGHLHITGRIKNMIVLSGGKKVFPEEVENVIEKSKYLREVCVFGYSRTFGAKDGTEEIVAVVVPKEEYYNEYDLETLDNLVKTDIKNLCQHLTPYKRPISIVVRKEALPKTTTLKVKRREVIDLVKI
ncbi:MAG: AMP-binding protein [Clostridiaceae bacterium]|nr:AMP-binding protein [Clostridiaceae bacterium]